MMDYKKIIRSRALRKKILNILSFVPDSLMVRLQYMIKFGFLPNLTTPQRFTEKIQVLKLKYRNELLHKCVDKYDVREYITEKGLGDILIPMYGLYTSLEQIQFENLPDQFIIKKTNGGGGNDVIICTDKSNFNIEECKKTIRTWMKMPYSFSSGREWAYNGLRTRILIEQYLENEENPQTAINDYKFFCFQGKPELLYVDIDRFTGHKRNFYDMDWKYIPVESDSPNFGDIMPRPEKLDEMAEIARKLSQDFPFVRVDLYCVRGKIYFGELTFYPLSGYVRFTPDSFDFDLGKRMVLP